VFTLVEDDVDADMRRRQLWLYEWQECKEKAGRKGTGATKQMRHQVVGRLEEIIV